MSFSHKTKYISQSIDKVRKTNKQDSVVTKQPIGSYDPLLPSVNATQPHQQPTGTDYKGNRPYQSPELFSPIWPIDSAYGTNPDTVNVSRCPKERQVCSTRDPCPIVKDDIVSDDDDVVIPPSGVISSKTVDDDNLTETQSDVSEGEGLATASSNTKLTDRTHDSRWVLPRRRDTIGGPRREHKNTPVYHVLRHPRKNSPRPFNTSSNAVSASGYLFAKAGTKSARHANKKGNVRCEYPDVLHALRHPSVKTPLKHELWSDESGDDCMRNGRRKQGRKMSYVGRSDKEKDSSDNEDSDVSRSGTSPYGRHSPSPIRRRGTSTSMEERHLSNTPRTDRHSTSARQLSSLSKSGQRSTRVVSSRIERSDVLHHPQTQD